MPFHVVLAPEQCQCHLKDCSSGSLFFRLWHTWGNIKRLKDFVDNPVCSSLSSELLSKPYFELDYHIPIILYLSTTFCTWSGDLKGEDWSIFISLMLLSLPWNLLAHISRQSLLYTSKLRCGIKPYWVLNHVPWPQCRASRVVRLFKKNNFSTTFSLLCFPWFLDISFKY